MNLDLVDTLIVPSAHNKKKLSFDKETKRVKLFPRDKDNKNHHHNHREKEKKSLHATMSLLSTTTNYHHHKDDTAATNTVCLIFFLEILINLFIYLSHIVERICSRSIEQGFCGRTDGHYTGRDNIYQSNGMYA